jgi:hypothetical protein
MQADLEVAFSAMGSERVRDWKMPKIFTPQVFSEISNLVAQGFSGAEIADKVGCKLASLRVKCSQEGILLRQSRPGSESKSRERLSVRLFGDIALRLE